MRQPEKHILVIFGASGDLTYRKLIPSVFDLYTQKLLPDNFGVLGLGRTDLSDDQFRDKMKEGIEKFSGTIKTKKGMEEEFLTKLFYYAFNTKEEKEYPDFKNHLESLNKKLKTGNNYIFYLATPPSMYPLVPKFLANNQLNDESNGFKRLIVEKPFGYDLESARSLNRDLQNQFREDQIYRIDHYLGKETVQNLLVTRFSNGIFEPLWNRNFIDHVEITSAEDIGVGDRGGYYEDSGALRDMVQNHLMLLASLVAMEPPALIKDESIRNEIVKVMQSLRPIPEEKVPEFVIRGQYIGSEIRGKKQKGYREEKGVNPKSRTETFVAMKFFIDNWRWAGVPFYIRTGKSLPTRVTEIVIHFRPTPHHLFHGDKDIMKQKNQLVIRIQPDEGILLKFGMKVPGAGFNVQDVNMDFHYSELNDTYLPSAYERLLLDCMLGDATLYSRADAVEAAWEFVDPILKAWKNQPCIKVHGYPAGTWGPDVSDQLIEGEQTWRYPCKNLVGDGEYCEL
ncbi:glucose-6-phosphate dehydrogenase [Alkalitalea saponilacus]|uniref:Glucose-6-phosphate 1-dehydrogenase n=1 Tax=Alkalitalea saponilacus TaxID=889453 RepID=A0A1T5GB90_9BACT|nr:glucose-6-phosphate dehydrogenase [Alkalitalea saponilacus]ASB47918.1 glucose-6-phosphate dehydrogenase [Alkalitalea saponilacus]SKC05698.1 glucose-6-phosphate 1-dehydrogenase [Alkalitalea saponilacus]